jgi:hypothetical protein
MVPNPVPHSRRLELRLAMETCFEPEQACTPKRRTQTLTLTQNPNPKPGGTQARPRLEAPDDGAVSPTLVCLV